MEFSGFDSPMVNAMVEGQPIHRKFLDGEITREEYERQRDEIIERHLVKSEPVVSTEDDFAAWR